MKLVSYIHNNQQQLGIFAAGHIYNMRSLNHALPGQMLPFLQAGNDVMQRALDINANILANPGQYRPETFYQLLAPVPQPVSCRDAYAFRQHVETSRRNRGLPMLPEFDQFPVFYFTNHTATYGPGEIECMPDHFLNLDFELECAAVIGTPGKNIPAYRADDHIAGFMVMNDLSARTLQMQEMKLNLGPAKGKDFATAFGPWLVTTDELKSYLRSAQTGHTGNAYDLEMQCMVNGKTVSKGNLLQMQFTFAEIIQRCSYGVQLHAGDVIGSGTVGTGCFLELNGTGKLTNPQYQEQWLKPGDEIQMSITGLGTLSNTLTLSPLNYSLQ